MFVSSALTARGGLLLLLWVRLLILVEESGGGLETGRRRLIVEERGLASGDGEGGFVVVVWLKEWVLGGFIS